MYKDKRIIAFIPARGGSKGVKRKNIRKINGKYLMEYTIDAARSSEYIDRIFLSTEDEEVINIGRKLGLDIPFLRPEYLAGDDSKIIDSVIYSLDKLDEKFDYLVLLQPTQPLREAEHIDEAIEKIIDKNEESLLSICEVREHPILMKKINEKGKLANIFGETSGLQRQDFEKIYKVNGSIYINKIEDLTSETVFNDNKLPYIMDKKYDLDIDEEEDLDIFRCLKLRGLYDI